MPRPPAARDKVLDAFVSILISEGERAATMDAVAARAGVSKGGLLYHFASREAMVDGLLERLAEMGREDVARMRSAPEGAVHYYLRTSDVSDSEFNTLFIACTRLTQESGQRARGALAELEAAWLEALTDEIGDPARAKVVQLIGDGLYFNATLTAPEEHGSHLTEIVQVIEDLLAD